MSLSTKRDLIIALHSASLVDIKHLFMSWKIPQMEEPGSYSPWGRKELDTTERLHFMFASHVGLFFLDIFFPNPSHQEI